MNDEERLIAEAEAIAAHWHKQIGAENVYKLSRQILNLTRIQKDAAAARIAAQGAWEPVPQSLEHDLITHAIKHGKIPQEYRVCRRKEGQV
jgi:hypothetical protein